MPYPLPLTRTEAYLAYKAGVIQQSDLKPSLAVPRNGIDAWLAYWTGLAADYPKREDGTPHILQEEEAYIAYLCGVINEYPEKCLRRVGAYLRYLISARWGRPDHPLNREELYLSLIKTQFIPSGDPSSDIVIDGTTKAPFVDIKMYGDTFQQTYTGKNLLAYPYYSTTKTVDGITFTDNGNGSVTVNGTLTSGEALFWITRDIWSYNTANIVVPAGTYTISPTGDSHVYLYVTAYGETQGQLGSWDATTTSKTFTISEKASLTIRISVKPKGATVNNLVVKPQLESGSTASPYEPFVGGQPSPSPDYPQPIQTVTGRQVVKVEGKNLWGGFASDFGRTNSGVEFVNKADGSITANGTATATALSLFSTDAISQNRLITLSAGDYIISGATDVVRLEVINTSGGVVADTSGSVSGVKAFSISEPTQVAVRAKMGNTAVANNVTIKPMLEAGSTATTYEPYSSNDYEINLGKNLFDIATASDVWIKETGVSQPNTVWKNSDFIKVEPNTTYTLSGSTIEGGFKQFQYHEYSSNDESSYINQYAQTNWVNSITFTTHTGCNFIRVGYRKDSLKDIQLEAGSTATDYAPYFEPIELCKLGDYQDYIWKDGEDWKVHKKITKYVCDSTLNWTWDASVPRLSANSLTLGLHVIGPINADTAVIGKSNKFVANSFNYVYTQKNNGFAYSQSGFISCVDKEWGSESEAKADILGSIFYFVLHGRYTTDTTITETNLIAQLEALVAGGAENGTTYIKVNATDPNLPGLLYVEAPKYE